MKIKSNRSIVFCGFLALSVLLAACGLPENNDPFSRVESVKEETLSGKLFKFDLSVSTKATHRLEKDSRMIALLASDVVDLDKFIGENISVKGYYQKEKMRKIFMIKSLDLVDTTLNTEDAPPEDEWFEAKKFGFVYPNNWSYTTAPNGTAYFSNKGDPNRRVFLTFQVSTRTDEEQKEKDTNILISNLLGKKELSSDDRGKEKQDITLFSNISDQKYHFIFYSSFEEFDNKKSFLTLLNSFVEGSEKVKEVQKEKERLASENLAKIVKEQKREEELIRLKEEAAKSKETPESDSFLETIFKEVDSEEKEATPEENTEENTEEKEVQAETTEAVSTEEPQQVTNQEDTPAIDISDIPFENILNENAFEYKRKVLNLSLQVPFGFWFRNFGGIDGSVAKIGIADFDFTTLAEAPILLEIVPDRNPTQEFVATSEGDTITLVFPRTKGTFFRLSGPKRLKDALFSIHQGIAPLAE